MNRDAFRRLAEVEDRHWWYRGMRATGLGLLEGEPLGTVLDAGCGTGGWGELLLAEGGADAVYGCDLHPYALSLAGARLGGRATRASVTALPYPDGSFDTVTSIDVLYHRAVPGDAGAIGEMARALRPGGRALVQVPAYDWLRGRHDDEVRTRERYGAATLATRLRHAGLEVERVTYANALLLPLAVAWRLAERILPPGEARDLDVPPDFVNRMALSLLGLERRLIATVDLPAGLSVLALARRPAA
jgi:SAM-dependent methyltransferase